MLLDIGLGDDVLNMTPKAKAKKAKISLKSLYTTKPPIKWKKNNSLNGNNCKCYI